MLDDDEGIGIGAGRESGMGIKDEYKRGDWALVEAVAAGSVAEVGRAFVCIFDLFPSSEGPALVLSDLFLMLLDAVALGVLGMMFVVAVAVAVDVGESRLVVLFRLFAPAFSGIAAISVSSL